jgi:hypothetical protein
MLNLLERLPTTINVTILWFMIKTLARTTTDFGQLSNTPFYLVRHKDRPSARSRASLLSRSFYHIEHSKVHDSSLPLPPCICACFPNS